MTTQAETLGKTITESLNEPNTALVQQVIAVIGLERTSAFFQAAQVIEAAGGLLTSSEKRRRTPGGVFFHLVRKGVSKAERKRIFPKEEAETSKPPPPAPPLPMTWEEAQPLIAKILQQPKPGTATIQMRLMGRPKRIARARTCIVCEMEGDPPPPLAKAFPLLPTDDKPLIGVFISFYHWERVVDKLLDFPENELIIDGWPYIHAERNFFGLFAQIVTVREFPHLPPEVIRGKTPIADTKTTGEATVSLDCKADETKIPADQPVGV